MMNRNARSALHQRRSKIDRRARSTIELNLRNLK